MRVGRDGVEHLGPVHADVPEGPFGLALVLHRIQGQAEVAVRMEVGIRHQVQPGHVALVGRVGIAPHVFIGQHVLDLLEIEVRAVDVARDGDERFLAQQRARGGDAASRLQRARFARVVQARAILAAVAQRLLDQVAQVGVVDDDLGDAGADQVEDVPDDQRPAAHFEQRLGAGVGQRAHTFAAPGGEDHGFHGMLSFD